jgi:hypothetical protein
VIHILKLAYQYKDKLQVAYSNIIFQDKYKFYNFNNYWNYQLKLSESSWDDIEMTSVDQNDNVRGYLRAGISRTSDKISCLGIMNFYDTNVTFSRDLYQFLKDLFEKYNFRKFEFNVVVGNPIEKMYDKYIKKYGGSIVGIKRESTKLQDDKLYDIKLYEIFKENYMKMKEI